MQEISSEIWLGGNQPYGVWRVGNPILKYSLVLLMLCGIIFKSPTLSIQCSVTIFLMLWVPQYFRSKILRFLSNLGIGGFIVALFDPSISNFYKYVDGKRHIPNIGDLDVLNILAAFFIVGALIAIIPAFTSRDYAWLISTLPEGLKKDGSSYIHSFAYATIRIPNILKDANLSMLSRGFYPPYWIKKSFKRIDAFGIWLSVIFRELREMVSTIEYVIISKIKPQYRYTPIAKHLSATDYSYFGIIIFGIIVPRLISII